MVQLSSNGSKPGKFNKTFDFKKKLKNYMCALFWVWECKYMWRSDVSDLLPPWVGLRLSGSVPLAFWVCHILGLGVWPCHTNLRGGWQACRGKFLQMKKPFIKLLWIKLVLWQEWAGQELDLFSYIPGVGVSELAVAGHWALRRSPMVLSWDTHGVCPVTFLNLNGNMVTAVGCLRWKGLGKF